MKITPILDNILSAYDIDTELAAISPLGNGLINDTYLVTSGQNNYVLQKINHNVFPSPLQVANNTQYITQHLEQQKAQGQYHLAVAKQCYNNQGQLLTLELGTENHWRLMTYIDNSDTIEKLNSTEQARLTADSFARFSLALASLETTKIVPIIADFHDIGVRFKQLQQAISQASTARLSNSQALIDDIYQQVDFIKDVKALEQQLPVRICHNDTKINNLLFKHNSLQPKAVVDLDTCMPGYLMYDFGDMVRTSCASLAEDDVNIENMTFKLDIFTALLQGYLTPFGQTLSKIEQQSLLVGARLLPLMLAIRFLTDYLNDDVYFHCHYDQHNLARANNQFKLFQLVTELKSQINQILDNISAE